MDFCFHLGFIFFSVVFNVFDFYDDGLVYFIKFEVRMETNAREMSDNENLNDFFFIIIICCCLCEYVNHACDSKKHTDFSATLKNVLS